MKKILLFILSLFIFCAGLITPINAQSDKWIDKTYDFSKAKVVFLAPVFFSNNIDEINMMNIREFTEENFKVKDCKILTAEDTMDSLKLKGYTKDISRVSTEELYSDLIAESLSISDLYIEIGVTGYGFDSEYIEGQTISYQTTNTSTVRNSSGNTIGYVNTPQTNYINIPGGNVSVASTYVDITVYDSKTQKAVFRKKDYRRKANADILSNTNPEDLYKRILKDLSKDLYKLIKEKKWTQ